MSGQILAAEWVLPVTSPPVRDGVVVVEGSRLAWLGDRRELPSRYARWPVRAFGRSLLLPGWVNAHSHLNLTAALGLLEGRADAFVDWVRQVIRLQSTLPPELVNRSVTAGLDLLASTGTTTTAHVAALPDVEPFLVHPMRAVLLHEPIGFRPEQAPRLLAEAEDWLAAAATIIEDAEATRLTLGLAPHAPYSVSARLARLVSALAEREGLPLSVHLAETRAEEQFLREGGGPFEELLRERGSWDDNWRPPGANPVQYLAALDVLRSNRKSPLLAVHANYLDDRDVLTLAASGAVAVWCPGSHAFFGHEPHPAPRLLAAGVPIALGTDSLASNQALSMLHEVRLAAERCPGVSRETWLRSATVVGAGSLGLGDTTGSLEPGKAADLQVLEAKETTDPLTALFESDLRVRAVLIDGNEVRIKRASPLQSGEE
jgi:aminodeoxyfutalosine deaminase